MFLKSLTLKGFKSFADKTTLEFEPGVTVVVGPNGSGKSNVVDSVAWVLGAQGARALRGGKMDDVIFAGTADRPALGRAEVSLTIDNSSHLLPIDFSEVTITRTLFRTGESEYMINGAPCRLLDIQELLSDTGIGRQQHVIVGQGQLDTVLNARPEDRRAIIEEAAGILKFRKRKEKAERRLEATEGNLLRLTDLLREVRRQLRPLERQADAARRHDGLVAEVRAIRLHLAGREIEQLRGRQTRREEARAALATEEQDVRVKLRSFDTQVLEAERALAVPGDDDVADMLARTEALRERARGLANLIAERQRGVDRELLAVADEGVVETLVADAAALREELAAVEHSWEALAPSRAEVESAEARVNELRSGLDVDGRIDELARTRRDAESTRATAAATLRDAQRDVSQIETRALALTRDLEHARAQLAEVDTALDELAPQRAAAAAAEAEAAALRTEVESLARVAPDLSAEGRELRAAEEALHHADEKWRTAEADASRARARADMLAVALAEAHAASGADAMAGVDGVLGPLVDLVEIESGVEVAVAAALGESLRAVVVRGDASARDAVRRLKQGDGQALFLVAGASDAGVQGMLAPPGTQPLASYVRSVRGDLDALLARLLSRYVLVDGGWSAALDIALADQGVIAVTREGDRFGGATPWRAGPPGATAVTPAALATAVERAEHAETARDVAAALVEEARQRLATVRRAELVAAEQERLRRGELDRITSQAAALRQTAEVRGASLDERRAQLTTRANELEAQIAAHPSEEIEAHARVAAAEAVLVDADAVLQAARLGESDADEQQRARRSEFERVRAQAAKLRQDFEVRGAAVEERRAVLSARLTDVEARLAARPDEEAKARQRRAVLEAKRSRTTELATHLESRATEVERLAERLRRRRQEQSEAARAAGRQLDTLRTERASSEKQLSELRERASRLEVEEAELRLRLEQTVENLRQQFDCEPQLAIDAPMPEVADGLTLAGRARELERELRIMGPVNPLALSEYEALLERHEFLQTQLDDVRNTRRELTRVIKAVDEEIVRVFESAFADVARNFGELFSMLFPGGSGRLVLTNPEDMLNTGIEMEARPSGKMVRRLSLLSGGERSLTALAYLFAVFRARPSPFYLMDEVEAALDDVNLHRFLDLLHEFREEAQLLVVSHQKRTMEAADVLYGVSMPPGGSSRVVSQRMHDLTFETAETI